MIVGWILVRVYKPKNKYCKHTKLSERRFISIFYGYMEGKSAKETHSLIKVNDELELVCSRQAIEGVYLRLGNYLWGNFVFPKLENLYAEYELSDECPTVAHLVAYYLDMMRQAIEGEIDYQAYRQDNIEIGNMGTVEKLRKRSKTFNGLPAKTFHYHFAYVSFIDTMEMEVKSRRFTMDDVYIMLLAEFIKNPL